MTIWIASGNRQNWEVVKRDNIWGVPKRGKGLHSRVKAGDTILMYARSETHTKEVLPSVILGEFKVIELFEDNKPLFTAPPQMGDEIFPYRFRLKPV
jgi:predicted RNA-binding protein